MSVEFAKLLAVYGADTSGFDSAATRVTGTLEKQAGVVDVAFGSFFGNAMSQATNAVLGLGGEAVTSYANFERLGMSVQSLTAREMLNSGAAHTMAEALKQAGPAAQATLGWIQKLAIQSPFTSDGVSSAYRQALAYGFAGEEAKKLTQNLIDFAAGSGASEGVMNSIALALGQVKAKGHLAGQEVLQLVNTGLPVLGILAKAFGKTTGEVQKMIEAGLVPADAAIKAISQSIQNDFGGAAARSTHTFAGLVSSLEDIKEIGLREFFSGTFQAIQPYLDQFANSMQDPATLAAIRAWGHDLGTYVGDGAQAITGLIGAWQSLGGEAQSAIIHMGGLALVLPVLSNVASMGFQAVTAMVGFGEAAGAAISAWQAGLTLTTSLQVGFGATAVAVGAVTIALAALVAMWWAYNEQITKTQQAGLDENVKAWGQAFETVKAQGGGASAVLEVYQQHVQQINKQHEDGGVLALWFVDKQKILMNGFEATETVLRDASGSYDEYRKSAQAAAESAGLMLDASGNLVKAYKEHGHVVNTEVVKANVLMTRSMFEAKNGGDLYDNTLVKIYNSNKQAADSVIDLSKAAIDAKDIFGGLSSALKNAGLDEDEIKRLTDDVKVSMGDLSPAMRQNQDDVNLLTQAFADQILTTGTYTARMEEAKAGTLALTDAERVELEAKVASIATSRDAEKAALDSATAYWGLAESLKGAGEAEIAREAIRGLTEMMKQTGNVDGYGQAIEAVGLQFGLMDAKSLALAAALPKFYDAIGKTIPVENAAKALAGLNNEAADGKVDWDNFIKVYGTLPAEMTQVSDGAGKAVGVGTPAVKAGFTEWQTAADESVNEMTTVIANKDWGGLGRGIGKDIGGGFQGGISELTANARTAANNTWTAFSTLSWKDLGGSIGTDIKDGVIAKIPDLVAAAKQAATDALTGAQEVINGWNMPPGSQDQIQGAAAPVMPDNLRAILDASAEQYGSGRAVQQVNNGSPQETASMVVDMSGSTITFMVQNRQTMEDLMQEMRVR